MDCILDHVILIFQGSVMAAAELRFLVQTEKLFTANTIKFLYHKSHEYDLIWYEQEAGAYNRDVIMFSSWGYYNFHVNYDWSGPWDA